MDDLNRDLRERAKQAQLDKELAELRRLPLYLSVRQAADALAVVERTVYRMIDSGDLASRHFGRAVRIPRSSLIAYVSGQASAEEDDDSTRQAVASG